MANEEEEKGTIHELDSRLAEILDNNKIHPTTKEDIKAKAKIFTKLKLFPKNADKKKKEKIIKELHSKNFNQQEIINQQEILKQTINFNATISRFKKKLEDEIRGARKTKKSIVKLEKIYKGYEEVEIPISKDIRRALNIHKKRIFLRPKDTEKTRNRIKYYSGQDYSFLVKDRFSKDTLIPTEELEKINQTGNIVVWALNRYKDNIDKTYDKEKNKFAKSDPKKWKLKQKAFKKIYEVINHNLQIATNSKYNKKLVQRDKEGKIVTDQSEYPVRLETVAEMIIMYI